MENNDAIHKLLALKRYEQPPPGYHEAFLREFRRRQRVSLMQKNRFAEFFSGLADLWPNFQVPRLAYAGIAAAALAVAALGLRPPEAPSIAAAPAASLNSLPDFSLAPQRPVTITDTLPASTRAAVSQHYVLQPRPASNDRPLSF